MVSCYRCDIVLPYKKFIKNQPVINASRVTLCTVQYDDDKVVDELRI